jgi:hypothetical protein
MQVVIDAYMNMKRRRCDVVVCTSSRDSAHCANAVDRFTSVGTQVPRIRSEAMDGDVRRPVP